MKTKLALVVCLLAAPLIAWGSASDRLRLSVDAYRSRTSTDFTYVTSADGTRVVRASGIVSQPLEGEPVQAARRFLLDCHDILGIAGTDIDAAQASVNRSRKWVHVSLQQHCNHVPVMGPPTMVHFDADNRVVLVQNNFHAGLGVPAKPVISPEDATRRAKAGAWQGDGRLAVGNPELVIQILGGVARLSYRVPVLVAGSSIESWDVIVDAQNPRAVPRRIRTSCHAVGTGAVYPENPVTTDLTVVKFKDLDASTGLSGRFARTYDSNFRLFFPFTSDELAAYTRAHSVDRDYTYAPSDGRFSEASVYYHITLLHDRLKQMGFTGLEGPFPVFVNVVLQQGEGMDDAAYFPLGYFIPEFADTNAIIVGSGGGELNFPNLSHDSDILYHEYGHAVLDHIQPQVGASLEHNYGGAYGEGWADCVATDTNGNTIMGESVPDQYQRDIEEDYNYPRDVVLPGSGVSESHYTGRIVSSAFWDLRKQIGSLSLQAFLDGNYLLDGTENFFGIRDAIVMAGADADRAAIKAAFEKHGIKGDDPGNRGRIVSYDSLYTALDSRGTLKRRSTFRRDQQIAILVDATVSNSTVGYNLVPDIEVSNLDKLWGVRLEMIEATNGPRSWEGKNPYYLASIYPGPNAQRGTYTVRLSLRLGGTNSTPVSRTATFKVW